MSKIEARAVKVYKPEIMVCPKCGHKLKYAFAVSNKVIQFTSGRIIKIRNMGYQCPLCNDGHTYISATAHKMSFKGYTYSAKIMCAIEKMKSEHSTRDEICDSFILKGIEISDRNVDIIYNKVRSLIEMNYDKNIRNSYQQQLKEFGEIRIAIDLITINPYYYVIFYDVFNGELLAVWKENSLDKITEILSNYIRKDYLISYIITVRPFIQFHQIIKNMAPNSTKMLSFGKI